MTLTTIEELKRLASSDNANELTRRLARECLANREAQPAEWSGCACQFPGHMPRLYGDRAIAEINCDYDGGARLLFLSSAPPAPANAKATGHFLRYRVEWHTPSKWSAWAEIDEATYHNAVKIIATGEADAGRFYEARILYDAPPAPAVPDALEKMRSIVGDPRALPRRKEWISGQQYSYVLLENVEAMVDEACRTAMLNGGKS